MTTVQISKSSTPSLDGVSATSAEHQFQVRGYTLGTLQELVTSNNPRISCYPKITDSGLDAVIIGDLKKLSELKLNEIARCFALTANQNIHLRTVSLDSSIVCGSTRNELINLAIEFRDVIDIRQEGEQIRIATRNSPGVLSEAIAERFYQSEVPVTARQVSELSNLPQRTLETEAKRSFLCQTLKEGFSDPLSSLNAQVLAELMVLSTLTQKIGEDSNQITSAITATLSKHLPELGVVVESAEGLTWVQVQGDETLLKSVVFYEALQELRATLPQNLPVLFALAPILIDHANRDETQDHQSLVSTVIRSPENGPVPASMTDKLFSIVGTRFPWKLAYNEERDGIIADIGCVDPEKLLELDHALQQVSEQSNVKLIRRSFDPSALNIMHEHLGRDSMSRPEFMQAFAALRQRIEGARPELAWATVEAIGNMAVVTPVCDLAAESLPGLKDLSRYLPIPVVVRSPQQKQPIKSAAQLRALLKMMLPERARLGAIETEGDLFSASIQVTEKDYSSMQQRCQTVVEALGDSQIKINVEAYDARLSEALRDISPRTGKKLLSIMDEAGRISMDTWLDERHPSRPPLRPINHALSSSLVETLLATHTDRRYLNLLTIDPKGTKLKEDGISIEELPDGSMNVWIHLVNSSVLIPPFSRDRMRAYRFGASLYHSYAGVAPLLTQSKRFSLVEGETMPVASIRYRLSRSNGLWQQCESPHVELSLVRAHAAIHYDRSQSLGHLTETGPFAHELRLAASAAIALTLEPSMGYVHQLSQIIQSEFPRYLLRRANMDLSKRLADTGYPAIYQHDYKPSLDLVRQFVSHLNSSSMKELLRRPLEEIYENDEHLRILVMKVSAYNRRHGIESSVNISEFGLPALARGPNFSLGIDHSMRFSGAARRAEALVNMHQLSAALSVHPPLSSPEVASVFDSLAEARKRVPSLKREMELTYTLDQVADAMQHSSHFAGEIEKIWQDDNVLTVKVRAQIGADEHRGWVILDQNLEAASQRYSVGQTVHVRPLFYELTTNNFRFEISPDPARL